MKEPLKVIEGKFGIRAPAGLADELRRMADAADRGELTELVACYVEGDSYNFIWDASKLNCIAMTAMAHSNALDRMRNP